MNTTGIIRTGTWLLIGLITACGASSKAGKDPATAEESAVATTEVAEPTNAGQGIDVGMQYEDKGEKEKTDRIPPPTPTYKPAAKSTQAAN